MSQKLAFLASDADVARDAHARLMQMYGSVDLDQADIIVALGGDGFMLQTLNATQHLDAPVYGMNRGTVGFLMNAYQEDDLVARLQKAEEAVINPLRMRALCVEGSEHTGLAINEVSLLRETRQTAKLEVSVNNAVRIGELVCDGVLVATPAGSTAYNLSANGPILPLGCGMLALTPISPFRPRRWKGALLPDSSQITFRVLEPGKRPVSAVADQREVRDIRDIQIAIDPNRRLSLMFDPGHSLDDRISAEQFIV